MERIARLVFGLIVIVVGCLCSPTFAQEKPRPGVDPKADAILRKMGKSLADAKKFSFEAIEMSDEMADNGQKIQIAKNVQVAVKRPSAVAATVSGDAENIRYVYDGKNVSIWNVKEGCYAIQPVPDNIDAMFDELAMKYGLTAPLSDLMFSDPYKAMTERVRTGEYLGLHDVMGTKCHHLAFRQDSVDWQIWVEDSERAVPRKVVITFKDRPGYPQFMAVLDKWNLDADIPDSAFTFTAPANCKRIDLQRIDVDPSKPGTPPENGK